MITALKTMDLARKVLRAYFRDTSFPLIQHHVDSFNDLITNAIPTFIKVSNPIELELVETDSRRRYIRVYIGGRDGDKLTFSSPVEDNGTATLPHACRLDNRTYALTLTADLDVDFVFVETAANKKGELETTTETSTKTFKDVLIGKIPLMLRSNLCYLSGIPGYDIGECKFELGGYFIIDGAEKVLMTQEKLGNNMFYAGIRKRRGVLARAAGLVEEAEAMDFSAKFKTEDEYYVGIRTLSEDGSRGPFSHFLIIPSENQEQPITEKEAPSANLGLDERVATIQLPGFKNPVPVVSVFAALGVTSDRDLYEMILAGVPDQDRSAYDNVFAQLILSHVRITQEQTDMDILKRQTRTNSRAEVIRNLYDSLFSHIELTDEDMGSVFRRKAYMLGHMMRMCMDVVIGRSQPSDRDSIPFKRFETSGVLCFNEFRRIYRDVSKAMRLDMDSAIQYRKKSYEGKALTELLDVDNIAYYWKGYRMLNEFSKSFKGMWDGRSGIAQELARPSYLAVIHHLRKTDLQIDKTISTAPPRRLYASQFGSMCPIDSPDGSDIGYKKALTVLARVSTPFPSAKVKEVLQKTNVVRDVIDVHPSTWIPQWTKIFINSELYGVCVGNTEDLHRALLKYRREGGFPLDVCLAWNRLNNEYRIYCDAGRPVRPVWREGTSAELIEITKTWQDMLKYIDYIDASEMDTMRISMTPFSPESPSEIHMTFNMSAAANLVPYADHNPGPRSVFSIAQQKQAASWYHTNYLKRFDTISVLLNQPQKPLSQTWMYREVMGSGGCLGYGVNTIVAITMYGGNNQEDSVILNRAALERGMYRTMYFHSYDESETMLDPNTQTHTEIANPLKNESVKRKEGFNYELLDADGIIKVGSMVNDQTILVGILSPITNAGGQITGYRDVSIEPKRGQVGRVDAVYRYATADGLKGVKIRVAEERSPIIGDKMASRHSQKGTVGLIMNEEDMPFTRNGVRPDLIFNPHGIPTRMTVGQFLEAASNKVGLGVGAFIDATPFTSSRRVEDVRSAMAALGFEANGHEILYNGFTGEMMNVEIFMGPIYYQRLKHMVEDKINYRTTGPKTLLTHQPTQGRGNEGGLRIGEMERDALIGHGMSKFLNESLMERSDKAELEFNYETGRFDTSRDLITVPYAAGLYTHELESLHIDVKLTTA
jgi:DNA-directed RNA polymerase II subunit RPB2